MSAVVQFWARGEEVPEAVFRAAIDACPEPLAVLDGLRVLYANVRFARTFGFSSGAEFQDHLLTDFVFELGDFFRDAESGQSAGDNQREFRAVQRDGFRQQVRISASGFRLGNRALWVIGARRLNGRASSQHLTSQQLTSEGQRLESLGRVVGGVAHDFNNLLTGILLYCDLLLSGLAENGPLYGYVREIRRAGEQSAGLIQQLMAMTRRESTAKSLLSWKEIVVGMRELLARLIGEHIELVTDLPEEPTYVRMEPSQMRQILLNLVLNARDAMPAGGRITVSTDSGGANSPGIFAELVVRDTGCGMDAQTRSHLFETFFTTKRPGQGNGLGLANVKRMVEDEGGAIAISSAPGQGTRVTVHLPRVAAPQTKQFELQ